MSELGETFTRFRSVFAKDNVGENVLGANFYIEEVFVGDLIFSSATLLNDQQVVSAARMWRGSNLFLR